METMILVAGLAIAGLAGIAAAFYFSMRPDGSRARTVPGSRGRGPARTGDSQAAGQQKQDVTGADGRFGPVREPGAIGQIRRRRKIRERTGF